MTNPASSSAAMSDSYMYPWCNSEEKSDTKSVRSALQLTSGGRDTYNAPLLWFWDLVVGVLFILGLSHFNMPTSSSYTIAYSSISPCCLPKETFIYKSVWSVLHMNSDDRDTSNAPMLWCWEFGFEGLFLWGINYCSNFFNTKQKFFAKTDPYQIQQLCRTCC